MPRTADAPTTQPPRGWDWRAGWHTKTWPSVCEICHAWPSQRICNDCVQRFGQPVTRCPTCAQLLTSDTCSACNDHPSPLDACLCAVEYAYPWADCVARFKFEADVGMARSLAELMRHAPWVEPALEAADHVLPMPLSATRLRERGFNQAFELVRHLAPQKADAHTLLRLDHDQHQVGASREERFANVAGSFWLAPDRLHHVRGQRLVLVDDVMTTGASLFEAARTLRLGGATHITALVLARTPGSTAMTR